MRPDFWNINSAEEFEHEALELFRFQAERCAPFGEYLSLIGCNPHSVLSLSDLRYMPIEFFKSCDLYCAQSEPQKIFTSSATTGSIPSRHLMADLGLYEAAFVHGFERFYGSLEGLSIYGLLPSYLEREGSSLIYMVDKMIELSAGGGFYLHDHERLLQNMAADPHPKLLLGVSYALLDLVETYAPKLKNTVVMETGGMKGRREELSKEELHKRLCEGFGVDKIHSEYGMAELTSQAYSCGGNSFRTPKWMGITLRELSDPFAWVEGSGRGGINIIDLASRYSCAFIETQDVGRLLPDGSFSLEGRVERSEIRGCNLLID
ncbi:MAG: acyltransferase [Rikenellaceae bacterium]